MRGGGFGGGRGGSGMRGGVSVGGGSRGYIGGSRIGVGSGFRGGFSSVNVGVRVGSGFGFNRGFHSGFYGYRPFRFGYPGYSFFYGWPWYSGFSVGLGYYDPYYYPYYSTGYYAAPSYAYESAPAYYGDSGYSGYSSSAPPVVINQYYSSGGVGGYGTYPESRTYTAPSTSNAAPSAATDRNAYYLLAFPNGNVVMAVSYWVRGNVLHYVTRDKQEHQVPLSGVDAAMTEQLNRERGIDVQLR